MTFATEAQKFASQPMVLLRITIGTTKYRYAHQWTRVWESGVDTMYKGLVHSMGTIDRQLTDRGPVPGDLTIELDNKQGDITPLLTSFTDAQKNIVRAKAEVIRLFRGQDVNTDGVVLATFQFARLQRTTPERHVVLHFTDQVDDLFGNLELPTVKEVLDALATSFASEFSGYTHVANTSNLRVPIAYGLFGVGSGSKAGGRDPDDCLPAAPAVAIRAHTFAGPQDDFALVYLACVTPRAVNVAHSFMETVWLHVPQLNNPVDPANQGANSYITHRRSGEWAQMQVGLNDRKQRVDVKSYDLTATKGYHVLVVFARQFMLLDNDGPFEPDVRVGLANDIDGAGRYLARPVDLIEHVTGAFNSKGRAWDATYVDTAAFTEAGRRTSDLNGRVYVPQTTPAMEHIRKVARTFIIDLFYNRAGKLAAWAPDYEGGASPSYPSAPRYTEAQDLIARSTESRFGQDGQRNGLINHASVAFRARWDRGEQVIEQENPDSKTNHDREVARRYGSDLVAHIAVARAIADRIVFRHGNPRMVVPFRLGLRATPQLGDIVHLLTTEVPGLEAGRFGIVEGLRHELDTFTTIVEFADWGAELTAQVYLIPDEADFIKDSGSATKTVSVTAASGTLDFSGVDFSFATGSDVKEWDIVDVRCWDTTVRVGGNNEFRGVVDTVADLGAGNWRITLKTGPGMGSLPDTTESGIQDWRLMFSSETCPVSLNKYGKVSHGGTVLNGGDPYVWRPV